MHLLNGNTDEALLAEVFSAEGVGTMVYGNDYQQIRRVMKKDVRALLHLIKNSVEHAELVKRTRAGPERRPGAFASGISTHQRIDSSIQ